VKPLFGELSIYRELRYVTNWK